MPLLLSASPRLPIPASGLRLRLNGTPRHFRNFNFGLLLTLSSQLLEPVHTRDAPDRPKTLRRPCADLLFQPPVGCLCVPLPSIYTKCRLHTILQESRQAAGPRVPGEVRHLPMCRCIHKLKTSVHIRSNMLHVMSSHTSTSICRRDPSCKRLVAASVDAQVAGKPQNYSAESGRVKGSCLSSVLQLRQRFVGTRHPHGPSCAILLHILSELFRTFPGATTRLIRAGTFWAALWPCPVPVPRWCCSTDRSASVRCALRGV